jgi:hypothetical protein
LADLKLTIAADYQQASKAFQELANSSEATREKIEKFSDSFKTEQIDKFIDKQQLLEASLTGTRGEVASMTTAQKNYEKEIERLIRSGLSPESEAIKKLRDEHDKLADKIKKTNEVQKSLEQLMKGAEKAALGMVAAIGAGITALGIATQKTAEAGDEFAKTARVIGMTAETFQELDYAAKMSGVDNLKGSLEKLNKSIADVKNDTGSLTNYLKENDQQLLDQLKNVNSNEEAFNLLMDAIGKAPDEFTRAGLAQAAFGKSGQELILLANEGADGISNLREEAQKYGVISNESAAASEAYLDAQARLKAALNGVTTELTAGLLPGLTNTITKMANFIAGVDDWEGKLKIAGYALAGVAAGLTAFLAITKGAAVIHGLATAFKALTSAIASNPIGAIAVVVTAVLIPALIALYKNWDTVQTYLQQGLARLQFAFKWLGSVIEEGLVVAFNSVKSAAVTFVDFIYGNIIRAVGNLLEVMGKLPFVGDLFLAASEKVKTLGNAIGNLAEDARRSSLEAIQAAHDKQDATEGELKNTLLAIDTEARARRAAIEQQKKNNDELIQDMAAANEAIAENEKQTQEQITQIKNEAQKSQLELLKEHLNEIPFTEQQIQTQQIAQFQQFLQQRMELEKLDGEERILWLEEQREMLLELDTIQADEKLAAQQAVNALLEEEELRSQNQRIGQFEESLKKELSLTKNNSRENINILKDSKKQIETMDKLSADQKIALTTSVNDMIVAEEERLKRTQLKLLSERLNATSTFFNGVAQLTKLAGQNNYAAAIASKALAAAEAGINTALAFTKALASSPPPLNYIMAAGVLAAGIAQQVSIATTPIPSAETGGRFIVPHSVGSDSGLMRVNSDEEVEVTPRGMTGFNKLQNIIVQIEKQTIFDVVNDGITSGDILISTVNY